MEKLVKTSELADTLGVSKQTIINTVKKLELSPLLGKKSAFLFDQEQARSIAEFLDKLDKLDQESDPKENDQKQQEADPNVSESNPLFEVIEILREQIRQQNDQLKVMNDQLKTKDDQISELNRSMATLIESNKNLIEANTNLSNTAKTLAANATMHTLSDKKEALIQDQGQEQEPLEIVPKEKRSFLDKLKELFS